MSKEVYGKKTPLRRLCSNACVCYNIHVRMSFLPDRLLNFIAFEYDINVHASGQEKLMQVGLYSTGCVSWRIVLCIL